VDESDFRQPATNVIPLQPPRGRMNIRLTTCIRAAVLTTWLGKSASIRVRIRAQRLAADLELCEVKISGDKLYTPPG